MGTDDVAEADSFAEKWKAVNEVEKAGKKEEDDKKKAEEEAKRPKKSRTTTMMTMMRKRMTRRRTCDHIFSKLFCCSLHLVKTECLGPSVCEVCICKNALMH